METLIIEPKNQKQLAAIKAFLKSLNVSFRQEKESPYDPEFVEKADLPAHVLSGIRKGQEDIKTGKSISLEQFKENIAAIK